MQILLVRHGPAQVRDPRRWPDDADRPLTTAGRAAVRRVSKGLEESGIDRPAIRTSPAIRCSDTARILAESLGVAGEVEEWGELSFGAPPESLVERLRRDGPRSGTVALVGHEPGLGRIAGLLLFGESVAVLRLRRAGAALIEVPRRVGPSAGRLSWAMTRGQLADVGKAAG